MRFLNLLIGTTFASIIPVMIFLTVLVLASEAKAEEAIAVPYKEELELALSQMDAVEQAAKELQVTIDEVLAARENTRSVAPELIEKLKVSHNELADQLRSASNAITVVIEESIDFSISCEPTQDGLDACVKRGELTVDLAKIFGQGRQGLALLSMTLMVSEALIEETSI